MNISEFSTILKKIGGYDPLEYGFPLFVKTIVWENPFQNGQICEQFNNNEEKFSIINKINERIKKWNLEYKREFHLDYLPYYPVHFDTHPMIGDSTIDDKLLYSYAITDKKYLSYRYNKTLLEYFDEKIKFETKYKKTNDSKWEKYRNKVIDWFSLKDVDPENVNSFFNENEIEKLETLDVLQKNKNIHTNELEKSNIDTDSAEYQKEYNAEAIARTVTIKRIRKTNRNLLTQIKYLKKYRSGHLTDSEIQQIVDSCRKKNGKINYTAVGKIIGLSKDTIRNLISNRELTWLIEKPESFTTK